MTVVNVMSKDALSQVFVVNSQPSSYACGEKSSHSPRAPLNISPVEDDWLVIGVDGHA